MQAKKALAEMLIGSLKGEREAWDKSLTKCRADKITIEGDILICSGILAYLGVFVKSYREECVKQWTGMLQEYNIQASETVTTHYKSTRPTQHKIYLPSTTHTPYDRLEQAHYPIELAHTR